MRGRPAADRAPFTHTAAAALAVALVAALLLPAVAVPQQPGPSAVAIVRTFYTFHLTHNIGFTPAAVRRRARWLSPGLLSHCRSYFARPTRPDEVPPVDGDPFTDSQEYPGAFQVGLATVAGDTARVPVTLIWASQARRTVTVLLVRGGGTWRIDDVHYGAGPSLRALLSAKP